MGNFERSDKTASGNFERRPPGVLGRKDVETVERPKRCGHQFLTSVSISICGLCSVDSLAFNPYSTENSDAQFNSLSSVSGFYCCVI